MTKAFLYILLFLETFLFVNAQNTSISFINKSYIGDTIYLIKEKDFITRQIDTIAFSKVNAKGEWSVSIPLKNTSFVYIPLYRNEAWLCVEPNQSYKIKIPNKQHLSVEDSLNNYFQPIVFYAKILNMDSSACNEAISLLDYTYDTLFQKHIKNIRYKIKRKKVDSLISIMNDQYKYVSSTYFKSYLFYKIALLKYLSYEREQNFIIKYYFNDQPVLLNNIAYSELFNQIFSDFLSYYATTRWGEGIKDAIDKQKSPTELRHVFKRNPAFTNDTLIDLVILKGLHDAFYTSDLPNKVKFSTISMNTLLDSMIIIAKTKDLKEIAKNIKNKIKNEDEYILLEDYAFKDFEGSDIYLRNFRGKYLYLMIADYRSYEFATLLKQEKASLERFLDKLSVINIVLYPQKAKLKEMIKEQQLIGHYLFSTNENNLKKQLKIKAMPIFMIINPKGKIINKYAPTPDERIIPYIIQIIKE